MKKLISLFIAFLFVSNFVSVVFPTENADINLQSFDNFSIEQVQKTFSNTLSQENTNNNDMGTNEISFFNITDYNIQNNCLLETNCFLKTVCFNFYFCGLNEYLYQYKLFEKNKFIYGLTKYKITFNSYFAEVLFDNEYNNNIYINKRPA